MKLYWKVCIAVIALLGCCFILFVAPVIRDLRQMIYPTPNSCSAFVRNYNPQPVIDAFESSQGGSSSSGDGNGQSAGFRFITNKRDITHGFALQKARRLKFMNALDQSILSQLAANGASIIGHSGDPQLGFHYSYRIGPTTGTVWLSPLRPNLGVHRGMALPEGIEDVTFTISITEKWFPGTPANVQAALKLPPLCLSFC